MCSESLVTQRARETAHKGDGETTHKGDGETTHKGDGETTHKGDGNQHIQIKQHKEKTGQCLEAPQKWNENKDMEILEETGNINNE